jgi:phosphatidate phosphatase APP1
LKSGGKADVYVDGKLDRTVDVYSDEEGNRTKEAVWHFYGLNPGKHTVRLVVRGEPYGDSTGTDVSIDDLIVFRSDHALPRRAKARGR